MYTIVHSVRLRKRKGARKRKSFSNWGTSFYSPFESASPNCESRDIETGSGTSPVIRWVILSPLSSLRSSFCFSQLSRFFSSRTYLRQSSSTSFLVLRSFRRSRIFTRPWLVRTAKSSGESAERFAFFWTRAAAPPSVPPPPALSPSPFPSQDLRRESFL